MSLHECILLDWLVIAVSRLLLRVRLLYYLKQEMIGSEAEKVLCGAPSRLDQAINNESVTYLYCASGERSNLRHW